MRTLLVLAIAVPALALAFVAVPASADPDSCPPAALVDPTEEVYVHATGQCTGVILTSCDVPVAFDFSSTFGTTRAHVFTSQSLEDGRCGSGALVLG